MAFMQMLRFSLLLTLALMLDGLIPARVQAASSDAGAAPAPQAPVHPVGVSVGKLEKALLPTPAPSLALTHAPEGPGLFKDAELSLHFRNFLASEYVEDVITRRAWVQTLQARFVSGFTPGVVGFGVSVSPFVALTLDKSPNAGSFVYADRVGDHGPAVFLGAYTANIRAGNTVFKYGLQPMSNPILESQDIFSLPPTFQGLTMDSRVSERLTLVGGRLSAVKARGKTSLRKPNTTYGGVSFDHIDFLGADWAYSDDGKASLYIDRASDVWNQLYVSLSHGAGDARQLRLSGRFDAYYTRNQGASRQGVIDNKAYSLSMTAERGANAVLLGYQKVVGDQFFDYFGETWGDALLNAMDVDYNAPNESSVQLRYELDGGKAGLPGFKFAAWVVQGWGADARAGAAVHASEDSFLHYLYWKNGKPVHGRHREVGINPAYVFQRGPIKNAKLSLLAIVHSSSRHYADSDNREIKLKLDVPFKVF